MSGGVDSTVCALLLKGRYAIEGFFMHLAQPDFEFQRERVQRIADRIGIELHIVDMGRQFEEIILAYFSRSYSDGLTPNPCMLCNREIKFGLLMETMLGYGMDCIATGHYARVEERNGRRRLLKGRDTSKDQSYFLAGLTREQLARVVFPLGAMTKQEVYNFAEHRGFADFRGTESQDVCFLGPKELDRFLDRQCVKAVVPGPIVTRDGREVGRHKGLSHYTVGQRRGLGIPDSTPWYVLEVATETNTIIVGKADELYRDRLTMQRVHWLGDGPSDDGTVYQVRIRSTHRGSGATLRPMDKERCLITFEEKQRAVTPGQFAVIYLEDEVVGSGEILRDG